MRTTEARFLTPKDHERWNRFVDDSPQGDVFCYSWWLETVTRGDYKIIVVEENQSIVAGIILPFYGANRINEPYLTRTTGVLYKKPGEETPRRRLSMERRWIDALLNQMDINNFVQSCMHHNFTDWLPFRWRGYRQTTRYTYIIDYQKNDMKTIWQNIAKSKKETIRKAARNSIHVEETDDINLVYIFNCLTFDRQGKKFPYSLMDLKKLDDAIQKNGKRVILKAVDARQNTHAVFYAVYNEKSAYALLSGGDPRLRSQGGHTLVLWNTIKYFNNKVRFLNFGGSDIEPIEKHIRSFGGEQTQYFHIYNEALVSNREGLRYHLDQVCYHAREILGDLKKRPIREFPLLFRKSIKALSDRIRKHSMDGDHA